MNSSGAESLRHIGVLFALPEESAPFVRRHPANGVTLSIRISGMGAQRAEHAAREMLCQSNAPDTLVICGFGGGLTYQQAGDLVVSSRVEDRTESKHSLLLPDARLFRALHRLPLRVVCGMLATVPHVMTTAAEKQTFAAETEAIALDMETAGAARAAQSLGVPWIAVRALTDGAADNLPFDFNQWTTADGQTDKSQVIRAVLSRPHKIPALIKLGIRSARAAQSLSDFLHVYLPHVYRLPLAVLLMFCATLTAPLTPQVWGEPSPCSLAACTGEFQHTSPPTPLLATRLGSLGEGRLKPRLPLSCKQQAEKEMIPPRLGGLGGHGGGQLSLSQSIALAQANSPQAKAARAEREAVLAGLEKEKPVARPSITATGQAGVQTPRVTFPYPNGTDALVLPNQFGGINLTIEQTVWRAGRREATDRYTAQLDAAEITYRKTLNDIAANVRKAALDVLRAEAGVGAARDGLTFAQTYAKSVADRIATGFAKPVDAETVKAQVAEAEAGIADAENGVELAKLNFNRLLGRPLETSVELEPLDALPELPASPQAAKEAATKTRAELVLLDKGIAAARAGAKLARLQDKPTLAIKGLVTEQTRTAFVPEFYSAALLELKWNIGDAPKARSDAREANAQADKLAAQREEAVQGILLEVETAWRKMRTAQQKITLADERLRGLNATLTVALKAYEVGRGTVIEVQAARREVQTAQFSRIQAQFDLHQAYFEFLAAQGQ